MESPGSHRIQTLMIRNSATGRNTNKEQLQHCFVSPARSACFLVKLHRDHPQQDLAILGQRLLKLHLGAPRMQTSGCFGFTRGTGMRTFYRIDGAVRSCTWPQQSCLFWRTFSIPGILGPSCSQHWIQTMQIMPTRMKSIR